MIVIDTLLNFRKELEKYDPEKITLFAFLRMAVRGDMLNLIDKNRRQEQRLVDLDDPAIESGLPQADSVEAHFELDEWLQQHTDLSRQELLEALANELDNTDREILLLMLEGVRATTEYAEVMGIGYQDEVDQRREVKRAKDRIIKKLQRFGQRMSKS
jgi:RNA polymerase sigma-70 factor (ECF subfamily)